MSVDAFWSVTTCPRPGRPQGYMPEFVAAWRAGGGYPPVLNLFVDDGLKLGQAKNFLRALAAGVAARVPLLHCFEDDVLPCVGAFARVTTTPLRDGAAFATWFSPHVAPGTRYGWQRAPVGEFYGLQAVTFTRAAAVKILDYQAREPWPHRNGGDVIPSRALVGQFYDRHVPDLFDHIGEASICNPAHGLEGGRVSHTFPGAQFDARTLGAP